MKFIVSVSNQNYRHAKKRESVITKEEMVVVRRPRNDTHDTMTRQGGWPPVKSV